MNQLYTNDTTFMHIVLYSISQKWFFECKILGKKSSTLQRLIPKTKDQILW